jgi:hypothetical protein
MAASLDACGGGGCCWAGSVGGLAGGHAKAAMPDGGRPCGESPGNAGDGVWPLTVTGVVFANAGVALPSRLSPLLFHHCCCCCCTLLPPLPLLPPGKLIRASRDDRRSYRFSCARRCVSNAELRRFGAGPSVATFIGTPGPISCGSMSLVADAGSGLILRFVPAKAPEWLDTEYNDTRHALR